MDENRLAQLAAARELAVKSRRDNASLKQKEKMLAEAEVEVKAREVDEKLTTQEDQGGLFIRV